MNIVVLNEFTATHMVPTIYIAQDIVDNAFDYPPVHPHGHCCGMLFHFQSDMSFLTFIFCLNKPLRNGCHSRGSFLEINPLYSAALNE